VQIEASAGKHLRILILEENNLKTGKSPLDHRIKKEVVWGTHRDPDSLLRPPSHFE
jgi:hypothetical protein